MLGYAPFLGQVAFRPALGQFAQPPGVTLTFGEVKTIKDGLGRAMKAIVANPLAPCVLSLNKDRLDSIQTTLSGMVDGGGPGNSYVLRSDELSLIDQIMRCGDQLTGGAVTNPPSEGPSLLPLAIPGLIVAASVGVSAYHGYKRNKSTGWAVWWGLMGLVFPVITPAVAIAQGYGKRAK
jgi:hypothetical protein